MPRRSFLVRPSAPEAICSSIGFQAVDRLGHGLPVGQRAAQPAVVHVVLGRFLGGIGDRGRGLTLGADEQHAATLGNGFADHVQGLRPASERSASGPGCGCRCASAIDVFAHAGVPPLGLVTKVNASFQQLTQSEFGKRHIHFLSGLGLGGVLGHLSNRRTCTGFLPVRPKPHLRSRRAIQGIGGVCKGVFRLSRFAPAKTAYTCYGNGILSHT